MPITSNGSSSLRTIRPVPLDAISAARTTGTGDALAGWLIHTRWHLLLIISLAALPMNGCFMLCRSQPCRLMQQQETDLCSREERNSSTTLLADFRRQQQRVCKLCTVNDCSRAPRAYLVVMRSHYEHDWSIFRDIESASRSRTQRISRYPTANRRQRTGSHGRIG